MNVRLESPIGVPRETEPRVLGENAISSWGEFRTKGQLVAQVCWRKDGRVWSERFFDEQGKQHGLERERREDGTVEWQVPWVHGQMHGIARQRDAKGRDLFRSLFVRGTGFDLWICSSLISEVRHHRKSLLDGLERWGHPAMPDEEGHYLRGKRNGVFRRWTEETLKRGYPQFFLDDEEVSLARYVRAQRTKSELKPYLPTEDSRPRKIPWSPQRVWLCREVREAISTKRR